MNTTCLYQKKYPLERNGIRLHLSRICIQGTNPIRNILLVHGSVNASHIFDIDYKDYSFSRRLAREGFGVWLLDIAGYGQSGTIVNGFLPRTDYAAEDIHAAVEQIIRITGQKSIDVLGWSWGTMTTGRFSAVYPEHLNKLVLFAPLLSGIGYQEVNEPFHHNTWETAVEDFQKTKEGEIDTCIADPALVGMWCSKCWRYSREYTPNAWRIDACVDSTERLIDLEAISAPTLIICGDRDPYMNYSSVYQAPDYLPDGSRLEVIKGGSHVVFYEKPFYLEFQNKVLDFLNT